MDNPLTPDRKNSVIEDALRTYPVASMPRDLTLDVLSRIQAIPTPPAFHLAWTDLALSLVLSICIGALWFSLNHLPPLVIAQVRKESILLYQQILVNARWLIPTLSFSLAGLFTALSLPYLRREFMK